mmetsp:Transcript_2538/g.9034  ORF Transcript_2538/g.9034 Transcript_2538/m.9034 type:complete len:210 (-) Transcript_2538:218-847(-)
MPSQAARGGQLVWRDLRRSRRRPRAVRAAAASGHLSPRLRVDAGRGGRLCRRPVDAGGRRRRVAVRHVARPRHRHRFRTQARGGGRGAGGRCGGGRADGLAAERSRLALTKERRWLWRTAPHHPHCIPAPSKAQSTKFGWCGTFARYALPSSTHCTERVPASNFSRAKKKSRLPLAPGQPAPTLFVDRRLTAGPRDGEGGGSIRKSVIP